MAQYEFKYRHYAEALFRALQEDAFYIAMKASVRNGSSEAAMIRYMDYSIREAEEYGDVFFPADHDYGVSIWAKPLDQDRGKEKHEKKTAFLMEHMGKESLETYEAIVDFMSRKAIGLIDETAWYLSIIGIQPGFQGQGLGAGLINKKKKKTDRMKVPAYLETFTPRTVAFYSRIGFRAVERFHEPTADATYWLMVRNI